MNKNAFIFDMDGLLTDSEIVSYAIFRDVLAEAGVKLTKQEYATHCCGQPAEPSIHYLIERYGLPWTEQELADKLHRLEFERAGEIVAKPGAQEILSYLKDQGSKLALATSSKVSRAEIILTNNHLRDFFNELTFSHEVKHGKPAPDIFLKAASKLGEKPGECVVFEDSEAGVRAAHAAGIPVICIPDLKQPSDEVRALAWRIEPSLLSALEFLRQS